MSVYLVTGGAGFVGSNLVMRLLKDGHEVDVLDNFSTGVAKVSGAQYFEGDISDINLVDRDYDACFHLAGKSRIQPSFESPLLTIGVNTTGTAWVMEWARLNGIKVVYAGSSSRHHNPRLSPYAESKWLGEEVCKMYRSVYGVDVSVVRFYNVYGPGEITDGKWAAVIGKWRGQIARGEPIQIVGDGEQRRDFTHVDDIVNGLILSAKYDPPEDAWELGQGENYSINEVAAMFKDSFYNVGIEYVADQPGNYRNTLRVNDDAVTQLGWEPKGNLKEYIRSLNN